MRISNLTAGKKTAGKTAPGQIDVQSVHFVDLERLTDSDHTTEEAIRFLVRSVFRRDAESEEVNRLLDFVNSSTKGRREQFEDLHFALRGMDKSLVAGVYRLKGDELTLCLASREGKRPTRIGLGRDGGDVLITLKRVGKKNAKGDGSNGKAPPDRLPDAPSIRLPDSP